MTKQVTIQVSGMGGQTEDGDEIVIASDGTYSREDGLHCVEYHEMIDGLTAPLQTRLLFGDGQLVMTREGEINTRMEFLEGEESICQYDGPYGTILLKLHTRGVDTFVSEERLTASILYDMQSGPEVIKDCRIRIEICSTH